MEASVSAALEELRARSEAEASLRRAAEEHLTARAAVLDARERELEARERVLDAREATVAAREAAAALAAPASVGLGPVTPAAAGPALSAATQAAAVRRLAAEQEEAEEDAPTPPRSGGGQAARLFRPGPPVSPETPERLAPPQAQQAQAAKPGVGTAAVTTSKLFGSSADATAPTARPSLFGPHVVTAPALVAPPKSDGTAAASTPAASQQPSVAASAPVGASAAEPPASPSVIMESAGRASDLKNLFEKRVVKSRQSCSPVRKVSWRDKQNRLDLPDGNGTASFRAHEAPFRKSSTSLAAGPPPEKRSLQDLLKADEKNRRAG